MFVAPLINGLQNDALHFPWSELRKASGIHFGGYTACATVVR